AASRFEASWSLLQQEPSPDPPKPEAVAGIDDGRERPSVLSPSPRGRGDKPATLTLTLSQRERGQDGRTTANARFATLFARPSTLWGSTGPVGARFAGRRRCSRSSGAARGAGSRSTCRPGAA